MLTLEELRDMVQCTLEKDIEACPEGAFKSVGYAGSVDRVVVGLAGDGVVVVGIFTRGQVLDLISELRTAAARMKQ